MCNARVRLLETSGAGTESESELLALRATCVRVSFMCRLQVWRPAERGGAEDRGGQGRNKGYKTGIPMRLIWDMKGMKVAA